MPRFWQNRRKLNRCAHADIRDVLSAVAVNMDKNIILPIVSAVSVNLQDVDPETALDYVLNIVGFEYIYDGSALIVGQKNSLSQDFYVNFYHKTNIKIYYIGYYFEQIDVLGLEKNCP